MRRRRPRLVRDHRRHVLRLLGGRPRLLPAGETEVRRFGILGDEGAARLAKELESNTSVTELNLASNSVGDAGAASLASALEKNATLETLDLS